MKQLNKNISYKIDLLPTSETMFIIFNSRRDETVFEFSRSFSSFKINRIHLRDTKSKWYLFGISNEINNIQKLVQFIKDILHKYSIKKTCTIGCSAGGFAAILFGGLVGVDQVHAISPQVVLSKDGRKNIKDDRFPELDSFVDDYVSFGGETIYLNIDHKMLEKWNKTKFFVYYPSAEPVDYEHVKKIESANNIIVTKIEKTGHCVARALRKKGKLIPFLRAIVKKVESS